MSSILLWLGLGVLLISVGVLGIGLWLIIQAGQRDTVSTAREGWIQRRSEKDEQGW